MLLQKACAGNIFGTIRYIHIEELSVLREHHEIENGRKLRHPVLNLSIVNCCRVIVGCRALSLQAVVCDEPVDIRVKRVSTSHEEYKFVKTLDGRNGAIFKINGPDSPLCIS